MKVIIALAVFVAFVAVTNAAEKVLMCYYQGISSVDQLKNADKCTHMILSFIDTNSNGELVDHANLQQFLSLKNSNPNMKLMIATGGWNAGTAAFSAVASDPNKRSKYAQNVKNFLEKYNLDGFDLDWEYPNKDHSNQADKQNFIELIKELKRTLPSDKVLTAAVGATQAHRDMSYNVAEMSKYLDYINVMTYDLNDAGSEFNAPLNKVKESIQGWLEAGAEPGKLVLGTAFYGKGMGQTPLYNQICKKIKSEGYERIFDDQHKVPVVKKDGVTFNYDDMESLKLKADVANQLNLGGAMLWSIDQDDTKNECGDGKFPLLNALSDGLNGQSSSSSNVPKPTSKPYKPNRPTQSSVVITTRKSKPVSNNNGPCNGYQADPNDCSSYFLCIPGRKFHLKCAPGTLFNKQTKLCNHAYLVKC